LCALVSPFLTPQGQGVRLIGPTIPNGQPVSNQFHLLAEVTQL